MGTGDVDRPPHVRPRLKQAPKLRDLFWCDLPRDAQLPEFWKRRPVIVIAGDGTLSGAVQVVPCSSQPQGSNRWAHQLATAIDGVGPSWAICDKVGTVAVSRLSIDAGHSRPRRLTQEEFTAVLGLVLARLPKLQAPPMVLDLTAAAVVEPMARLAASRGSAILWAPAAPTGRPSSRKGNARHSSRVPFAFQSKPGRRPKPPPRLTRET